MDNRKFEKLIDMIINENEAKARELFHEIVVEKSREIYESIMDEEMMDEEMDESMGGQVGDLMDEISAEESGVMEDDMEGEEEEYDFTDADGEEVEGEEEDFEDDGEEHEDLEDEVHDLEDRVVSIEDKLDDLLAQFEKEMGGSDDEEMGDEDMGDDEEEAMMEAVQLQAVKVTHGDDGAQKRSPTAFNSGKAGMDSKPVNFSGGGQEGGRSAPSTKDVKGAGSFKNAPGHKSQDLGKAPAPTKSQASGVNTKSPVAK